MPSSPRLAVRLSLCACPCDVPRQVRLHDHCAGGVGAKRRTYRSKVLVRPALVQWVSVHYVLSDALLGGRVRRRRCVHTGGIVACGRHHAITLLL